MRKDPTNERRYSRRKAADLPVTFRILYLGEHVGDMQLSGTAEAHIRDLGPDGIGLEASQIIVDGLHIAATHRRPRVFLQLTLPGGQRIRATAETVWCEQIAKRSLGGKAPHVAAGSPSERRDVISGRSFQIGLHFCELSDEDREALSSFLSS